MGEVGSEEKTVVSAAMVSALSDASDIQEDKCNERILKVYIK